MPLMPTSQIVNAAAVGYGTSLPTGSDGLLYILVDSVTAPTYQWFLRYNAQNSTAYKWEYIGGPPLYAAVDTSETTTSGTYADLATVGPTVTTPRAGVYTIEFGAGSGGGGATGAYISYAIGAATAVDADAIQTFDSLAQSLVLENPARTAQKTLASSTALKMQYRVTAGTVPFSKRWISITPVRVS